ncbi:MAG: hypothetical protein HY553_07850 [Elusimicrobia bacterium]|nr:hypothetical protein [Elusimicrobiota bacterium]
MRGALVAVFLSLACGPARAQVVELDGALESGAARAYAAEAERLAADGRDFSFVFAGLCKLALRSSRISRDTRAEMTDLFAGLIGWSKRGGRMRFQARGDWGLHFVYGAYLAGAYGKTMASAAALAKEEKDAMTPGNAFDLGDWAVTLVGIRWAEGASHGGKAWVQAWADGRRSLLMIPGVPFERLPPRQLPSPVEALRVRDYVSSAF